MTRYLTIAILCILVIYGIIEARPLIVGPTLYIDSPAQNTPFPNGIVSVSGKAERTATLTMNGATLLPGEDGAFSSVLTFPRGGSILTFVATDRFGRSVRATRNVFVPFEN